MIRSLIFRTALNCNKCPRLVSNRNRIVWGYGNDQADIMLIGEAPGACEDKEGIPFCNPQGAGRNLDEALKSINLSRDNIFISNSVLCRPPNNEDPSVEEKKNCQYLLFQQLQIINPKIIVGLGRISSNTILGIGKPFYKDMPSSYLRSKNPQNLCIANINFLFVSTYHPAAWIYSPDRKIQAFKDWQLIKSLI